MTGVLYIDHVMCDNPEQLEIGVFDQDEICRGAKLPKFNNNLQMWIYQITIKGNEGFEYHFKLWDHATETELVYVDDFGEVITWGSGKRYGSLANPYEINFTDPNGPVEPEIIYWNDPEDWTVPAEYSDVTIPANTEVIIPADYTAYADTIVLGEGSSIVIEEGGQLYHSNDDLEVSMEMGVAGYSRDNAGYRLIACPVYTDTENHFRAVEGTGLNVGTYDLYKFDQSEDELQWINYEAEAFDLNVSEGYLYANAQASTNVLLRGYTLATNLPAVKMLAYTDAKPFAGWNLVGNPFTCKATLDKPYYRLNEAGSALLTETESSEINTMEGVFVKAASAEDASCTFTAYTPSRSNSQLNLTLSQGSAVEDNAIIRFDNGQSLNKFQLNPNHTKVYMTQDGEDYAVLSAPEMGEMPVSFKAETNGSYTLSFTSQEVSFNYLHLIDNMTGADVDLLANPSYSFNAQTTDYASRFKLVFATGNNTEDNFAFMSNGNLIVSNEGEATLQVVDVNGRILNSESINGSASVNVNAAAGVYVLRLVNGNNVKVQKIVIR